MEGKKVSKQEILNQSGGNSDSKGHTTSAVSLVRKSYLFLAMKQWASTESPERCQNRSSSVTSSSHLGRERSSKFLICAIHRSSQSSTSCARCIAVQLQVPAPLSMNIPKGLHPAGKTARVNTLF